MGRSLSVSLIAFAIGSFFSAEAFVSNTQQAGCTQNVAKLAMSSSTVKEEQKIKRPARKGPDMSEAIPFLRRPIVLTRELAGDFGFDPLGLAKNKESLWEYREAEVKHARLAMLAAAGWPLSELLDRNIADYFGVSSTLDAADRAPSVLNGGMDKVSPLWWGFCLGLTAAIDLYGLSKARAAGLDSDYVPGDLGFDPLGLFPKDDEGRKNMQLAEIKHGRIAMLAVTGFAIQEATSKVGVVDETPFFFQPITETASQVLGGLVN